MKIKNIEGMSTEQLKAEIKNGGKFVVYMYCVSIILYTFKRSSNIHFIKAGESALRPGLLYTLLTLILGWWGIPWGPIYTIQTIGRNMLGGKNVTKEVAAALNADMPKQDKE